MKIKTFAALILTAGLSASPGAGGAAADEARSGLSVSAELDIVSRYVWRGVSLSKTGAYQPSVNFSRNGLTANFWFNYGLDRPRRGKFDEMDLALGYESEALGVSVSPGFILYTFTYAPHYGEAYLKLSGPAAFFRLFTDHYLSMINGGAAGGYYGDAGLGHEKRLAAGSVWTNSALLGWGNARFNSFNYLTAGMASHLNVLILDTAVTFEVRGGASLRPHLTYHRTLPGAVRKAAGSRPDNLVLGIAAGCDFR